MKIKHLLLATILVTFSSFDINAATITVTNTNDSGAGSLRQAITDAASGDTINFSVTGMIALPGFRLVIDKNLTIQGPGASLLSIGDPAVGDVFLINNGVTASITGLTIRGAGYSDVDGGSGIRNQGTLTVSECIVSNNLGYVGGGILNAYGGTMAIINSTVSGNDALEGGGIMNRGTMIITNSTVSGNTSSQGGGVGNSGTLSITNSTISGNIGRDGGGIYNRGTLLVSNSTISGNQTTYDLNGNTASGGGIWTDGILTVTNSTISNNSAEWFYGGGIYTGGISSKGTETFRNSIVAGNTTYVDNTDIFGTIETASHNLIGNAASSGGIQNGVNGNIVGVNPLLGPLHNNGGPTQTHALLSGSPAINAGDNCVLTANGCGDGNPALLTDQRGIPRNGTVDIGAFERQEPGTISTAPFDFDGDGKTDVSIFRPSDGSWWYLQSSDTQFRVYRFGVASDKIVPGDYTGDGKADLAVFRPTTSEWFIQRSDDNSFFSFPFGTMGDVAAPADYDGDGKSDAAVFRPSLGIWFIQNSGGGTSIIGFGTPEDKPVPADFDGDGKSDIAIYRPSDGSWWYLRSSDSQFRVFRFGVSSDKPVQGDYTGDGKADLAVFRPSTGEWFVERSEDNSYFSFVWGANGDLAVPGDYDGDGKFDTAVLRPSSNTWYLNQTSSGVGIVTFGSAGDRPVPNAFVP